MISRFDDFGGKSLDAGRSEALRTLLMAAEPAGGARRRRSGVAASLRAMVHALYPPARAYI